MLKKSRDGVLLQCVVRRAFPKPRLEWRDGSGKVLPAEETSTQTDSSFSVHLQTIVNQSGQYRCVATQEDICSQVSTETFVPDPASKPSVTILDQTEDWALLQCEVLGASPQAVVVWKTGSGDMVDSDPPEVTERGGSYDIVLRATVTEDGFYRCAATQGEHSVSAQIKVFFGDPPFTGWIVVAAVLGTLLVAVVVVLTILVKTGCITCNREFSRRNQPEGTPLNGL